MTPPNSLAAYRKGRKEGMEGRREVHGWVCLLILPTSTTGMSMLLLTDTG